MSLTRVTRLIDAPVSVVFDTVADIRNYSKANPDITNVEFLTDSQRGVGTRFRETRLMKGRKSQTELEVTEYLENERVRMVADSHGTIWDSTFTTRDTGPGTELELTMIGTPSGLVPRIMNLLIGGMLRKALEKDMDLVKTYCERR